MILPNTKGVEGVKILVDGSLRFVTDKDSYYKIDQVEALVGFEKSFKHLDDHGVDIGSKGITNPKEVKKFKGEGMPLHYSTKKGNLVTFEVMFPSSLTEDQKKKIKEVLA
ncbi:unnamed protein product [Brassica oleracea]